MKTLTPFLRMTPSLLSLLILASHAAFAAGTNGSITALSSAVTPITSFVQAIAGLAAIGLLGLAIWEFAQHKQLSKAAWELVGVVIAGMISINAGALASQLGFTGSTL